MDVQLLRMFQRHVADQARFALAAVPWIEQSLPTSDHESLWIGCQQFLVGAANVSKALWGQKSRFAEQREPLRRSLGVDDDSPLKDVTFRNHFEHYDERLDRWWEKSPSHLNLDRVIGPPEMIGGLEDIDRFRVYDPGTHRIVFWGEEFRVQPIARELERLLPLAEAESEKPC